jgi:hypothetical protein
MFSRFNFAGCPSELNTKVRDNLLKMLAETIPVRAAAAGSIKNVVFSRRRHRAAPGGRPGHMLRRWL